MLVVVKTSWWNPETSKTPATSVSRAWMRGWPAHPAGAEAVMMGMGELTESVMALVMRKEGRERPTPRREERQNARGWRDG